MPIHSADADPHHHLRCFPLPQLHTEMTPIGEVFVAPSLLNARAHRRDESPEVAVIRQPPEFVDVWQVPEVLAMGYAQ